MIFEQAQEMDIQYLAICSGNCKRDLYFLSFSGLGKLCSVPFLVKPKVILFVPHEDVKYGAVADLERIAPRHTLAIGKAQGEYHCVLLIEAVVCQVDSSS